MNVIVRDPHPSPTKRRIALRQSNPPAIVREYSEATELPWMASATVYVLAAMLLSALVWCTVSKVDIVVSSQGAVATDRPLMVIQPFELSVIRNIGIQIGDEVRAGQTLVTLDPTNVHADTADAESKMTSGQAKLARGDAEIAGKDYLPSGSDHPQRIQRDVFNLRQAEVKARMDLMHQKVLDLQIQLDAKRAEEPPLTAQLAFQMEAVEVYKKLRLEGNTSLLRELEAERAAAELRGRVAVNLGLQRSLEQQINTSQAEYESFVSERRRELMEDYAKTKVDYDAAVATIEKTKLRDELVNLKAPADGIVLDVAQRAIGSVIRAAETVVTLVPKGAALIADIQVETRDIGRIKVGDSVVIKLETLPFEKYGHLEGRLQIISPDSLNDSSKSQSGEDENSHPVKTTPNRQQTYFRARVSIDRILLRNLPESFVLRPGMKVTADINVGQRTVLEYIVDPLARAFRESMREP